MILVSILLLGIVAVPGFDSTSLVEVYGVHRTHDQCSGLIYNDITLSPLESEIEFEVRSFDSPFVGGIYSLSSEATWIDKNWYVFTNSLSVYTQTLAQTLDEETADLCGLTQPPVYSYYALRLGGTWYQARPDIDVDDRDDVDGHPHMELSVTLSEDNAPARVLGVRRYRLFPQD